MLCPSRRLLCSSAGVCRPSPRCVGRSLAPIPGNGSFAFRTMRTATSTTAAASGMDRSSPHRPSRLTPGWRMDSFGSGAVPLRIDAYPLFTPHAQIRCYAKKKKGKGSSGGGGGGRKDADADGSEDSAAMEKVDALNDELEELLRTSVTRLQESFSKLSVGRATPGMLQNVKLADGTPLDSVAEIYVKDARSLMVMFYDEKDQKAAEKAIANCSGEYDFSIRSHVDGLHVSLPIVTKEFRQKMADAIGSEAQHTKTVIRNNRQKILNKLKPMKKKLPKDVTFAAEKQLQQVVDKYTAKCEELRHRKVKEISKS